MLKLLKFCIQLSGRNETETTELSSNGSMINILTIVICLQDPSNLKCLKITIVVSNESIIPRHHFMILYRMQKEILNESVK